MCPRHPAKTTRQLVRGIFLPLLEIGRALRILRRRRQHSIGVGIHGL
jgi:hypothetical protein